MKTPNEHLTDLPVKHGLYWSGIFAGALVALSLSFLIHTFNLGIGLSALSTSPTGTAGLAIGGILWLIICAIVTMFIAGFVSGAFAKRCGFSTCSGALHGFLAWSLGLLLALTIASNFFGNFSTQNYSNATRAELVAKNIGAAENKSKAMTPSKATESAADTAGAVAIAGFFTFFFGALAATVGGYYGVKKDYHM